MPAKLRKDVHEEDTWDLCSLYKNDASFEKIFETWSKDIEEYSKYRGTLGKSAKHLSDFFEFENALERTADNLGNYAFLKGSEDEGEPKYQRMKGRFEHAAAKYAEFSSFVVPEILAIPDAKIAKFQKDPILKPWKKRLEKILRYRPHTLSSSEENLLAMQSQIRSAPGTVFGQLTDVDMKFGVVKDEKGNQVELSHATFTKLLESPSRKVRQEAFKKYYAAFTDHQNTLAAVYNSSVQTDAYHARARKYKNSLDAALFDENVPEKVFENLIQAVHSLLPDVKRYYRLRAKALGLSKLHHFDLYVPLAKMSTHKHTFDEAVEMVLEAVKPLGEEYVKVLREGLTTGRWVDKYPNKGKHSGAFSAGSFDSKPYILMNYDEQVLDHVFTLVHEAGHSMHSFLANTHQSFGLHNYTIFSAEIASTLNEQLLLHSLLQKTKAKNDVIALIDHAVDGFRRTVIRQVMFAEFEKNTHVLSERGEPLTANLLRKEYRKLLEKYFGPDFEIDEELSLEGLRIPHFYRAFYVYKYATGLIAATVLSERILTGSPSERAQATEKYLEMLKAGGSDWPLDLLKEAGVDLTKEESFKSVKKHFRTLIDELEDSMLSSRFGRRG